MPAEKGLVYIEVEQYVSVNSKQISKQVGRSYAHTDRGRSLEIQVCLEAERTFSAIFLVKKYGTALVQLEL